MNLELQPLPSKELTERQYTQYEVPCEHHYEYVDKIQMALSKTFPYDHAFPDGPPPSKKTSVELDRIGEDDCVTKYSTQEISNISTIEPKPEVKEVETHDNSATYEKPYITVIG